MHSDLPGDFETNKGGEKERRQADLILILRAVLQPSCSTRLVYKCIKKDDNNHKALISTNKHEYLYMGGGLLIPYYIFIFTLKKILSFGYLFYIRNEMHAI